MVTQYLLKCSMSKGPTLERGHLKSLIFRSWEPYTCSVRFSPTAADTWCVQKWPLKENSKLCNWKIPLRQQFTFKLNLWCYDLNMIHEQEKPSAAQLQPNNQALIQDLIKVSQYEEAGLTKKWRIRYLRECFICLATIVFHLTAALKGHEPQFECTTSGETFQPLRWQNVN